MRNLLDQLKHWHKMKPQDVFVVDGEMRLTYDDVLQRALRFAGGLNRFGVAKGARIASINFNSYRYYDLYYGLSAGGFVFVPLNFRLAGPEIAYQINDSGAEVLILDPEFEEVISKIKNSLTSVKHFVYTGAQCGMAGALPYDSLLESEPYTAAVSENDLFGIYYTGGTTGLAKGVMLSQRNLISNAFHLVAHIGLSEGHVTLHSAPMFHLADGATNFAATLAGGSHVLVKAFEPISVLNAIQTHNVTFSLFVPTMINALVNHPEVGKYDLGSLKLLAYGASPISTTLLKRAYEVFSCEFMQLYGMTEEGPIVTVLTPQEHRKALTTAGEEGLLKAAGRQIIGVEARVVDGAGNDVKPGEVGEVITRGDNIMQGYWNKPQETAAALIDGWYWTKDLARIDGENYIYIVDRAKDMIISGAENIYSVEVEDALSRHPAVMEAAVIGVPDEKWGEAVKGIVVLKPGHTATEVELRDFCRELIAGYKVPKSISFLDALPKSGAGKILKRELRKKFWAGSDRQVG